MSNTPAYPSSSFVVRRFTREESPSDFDLAVQIRMTVFVEEQQVPVEDELDDLDDEAVHWIFLHNETPVATGRVVSYQEGCQMRPVAKIGRIAVNQSLRGQKLGERLMQEILTYAASEGFEQAILDAQTRVLPFYAKLGFVPEGDEFEECGIMHFRMRKLF